LEREAAFAALAAAGGAVTTAVVMQRLSLDRAAAEEALRASHGRLDLLLG
jgi:N-acetylmuramic acid 6-phosphate (MurNAc-6-P) etherase